MPFFSNRDSQPHVAAKRKERRPEGVSRRRKKELGFETLEERQVMSANPWLADSQSYSYETQSYSSATPEGQAAILQQELYRALLQSTSATTYGPRSIPTDPLLNNQWHLINSGQQVGNPDFQAIFATAGEDINVAGVWNQDIYGNGVIVGVFEPGGSFQTNHPDLAGNLDELLGYGGGSAEAHGTAVAGLIAALSSNGQGGTGVAPGATLVPMSFAGSSIDAIADGIRYAMENGIDIVNNSWGPADNRGLAGPTADETLALRDSIFFGRDGLGVIHVWAAGNGGKDLDSASYDGWQNSRYVISVTGVDHDGQYNNIDGTVTGYMEAGASVLVAAPTGSVALNVSLDTGVGSGIWTTDMTGQDGYNETGFIDDRDFLADTNYTSRFNGTSASTPIVSGVIALMLEANPNLSWRDVQEILVRSARQNAEFSTQANGVDIALGVEYQNTWIINQVPLFHDPDIYDPLIDNGLQIAYPTLNPLLTYGGSGAHYTPTPQVLTNGAGYTVSQGRGTDREQIGFAHGVVDAELAVNLAQQWSTKNQHLPNELTFTTAINVPSVNNLPGAEVIPDVFGDGTRDLIIPGGLGGATGFSSYWAEFYADDPDFTQTFPARGEPIELTVPDTNNMTVNSVEITVTLGTGTMADFMDNVRMVLVSPTGTHSELNHYFVDGAYSGDGFFHQAAPGINPGLNANGLNGVSSNPTDFGDAGSIDNGTNSFTFSTNRIWGERSDNALVIDPTTGLPYTGANGTLYNGVPSNLGDLLAQGWQLHFENYGIADLSIASLEVAWHGSPIQANTERISGLIGIDDNRDDAFNYSRVISQTDDLDGDLTTNRLGEVINVIDVDHESMGENITVIARRVSDGAIVDQFVTGADGNFYFDLVPDDYIIEIQDPLGRVALTDTDTPSGFMKDYQTQWRITPEHFQVWNRTTDLEVPVDANGVPEAFLDGSGAAVTYGMSGINFLLDPGQPALPQVEFSGVINADFNSDGVFNGNDVAVPGVKVFADVNRNGVLDAGEIVVTTNINGQYNLVVPNTISTVMNVGVVAPVNWSFGDPAEGFSPLFVEPGDVFTNVDFELTPPLGASVGDGSTNAGYLMGVVYEDVNNNSSRQATELGVSGLQVFIDTNNNGTREVNEATTITNANGAYIFANVAPGVHRVRAVPVAPLLSINPGPGVPRIVTLAGGGTVSQTEFGVGLGSNPATSNLDFGDLPAAYGITTLAENGARHGKSAYYLGAKIDVEPNGQPSANANGDDLVGGDEDGILVDPLIPGTTGHLVAVASRHGGNLQGWIDFNGDNVFQASEKVISNVALQPGANDVYFQIPANITSGNVYARFRYGEYGINSPTGAAVIGEVEDYILAKDPSALPAVIEHGPDFDEDGDIDGRDFLTWQRNHGATNATPAQGDANSDGVVGYADLVLWRNFYGTSAGSFSALTGGDSDEEVASFTSVESSFSDQVAAVIADSEELAEEGTLVEALLIIDTYNDESLTSVTEASAASSTLVGPGQSAPNFDLLFAADDDSSSEDSETAVDELDSVFASSDDLINLGVAIRDSSRSSSAAYLSDEEAESEEDEAFALAFEGNDWLQF